LEVPVLVLLQIKLIPSFYVALGFFPLPLCCLFCRFSAAN